VPSPPGELLPVGARTLFRALRTRSAAQLGTDWVWPYWLDRQLDPSSPAFVPRGHLPFLTNVTARNWTAVGNLDSPWEAVVDQRGLVTPWFDSWSLDWWVGAEDRWHLPSREVAVRQRLVDDMPVVETAMRVPSGDIVQRADAEIALDQIVEHVDADAHFAYAGQAFDKTHRRRRTQADASTGHSGGTQLLGRLHDGVAF
jgi:hypothetical protein